MIDRDKMLEKLVGMFRPYGDGDFLDHSGSQTICGPNDRAMVGVDTNFPRAWLIQDFGFTEGEADWLIKAVRERAPLTNS